MKGLSTITCSANIDVCKMRCKSLLQCCSLVLPLNLQHIFYTNNNPLPVISQKTNFLSFQETGANISSLLDAILKTDVRRVTSLLRNATFSLRVIPGLPETPLELASGKNGPRAEEIVDLLVAHIADQIDVETIFKMIYYACIFSQLSMVKHLIEKDPTAVGLQNNQGENIFHAAVMNFFHGPGIISYVLENHNVHELLGAKNKSGLEPHMSYNQINCQSLQAIVLNGADFNGSDKRPYFPRGCSSRQSCPVRLAVKIFNLLNYKFDDKFIMELDFHETRNQLLGNLSKRIAGKLATEFKILKQEKIFGKLTALNFLLANRLEINSYAKNVEEINRFVADHSITLFKGLIKSKIIRSINRFNMYEEAYDKFSKLIHGSLPLLIFEKISLRLKNMDLENILLAEQELCVKNA